MKRQINPLTLAQIVLLIVIVLIWGLAICHRNRPIETRRPIKAVDSVVYVDTMYSGQEPVEIIDYGNISYVVDKNTKHTICTISHQRQDPDSAGWFENHSEIPRHPKHH